ncbi:hypothetical protein ACFQ1S_02060 [Kibdelosporangium lantanae]|uniref:Uncharacterized protein n=1 Tax=Kibdelosporangium lantanae TaxID=1497396 RepID=A0ABW3M4F0_9PSEU
MSDPVDVVNQLGAIWSPDFDRYAETGDLTDMVCVLCTKSPCQCPPFGTPEYFALVAKRHSSTSDDS